ncbi:hypothetical protein LWI28_010376 [Acer negundo]|uniref:Uncharacterized protein n=1 Tax=Acer negundo TaxID=4023 RepID=A0AAD5J4I1_ACENE|nr:hypothetical protein LWI28_010376 [Acer negundo]
MVYGAWLKAVSSFSEIAWRSWGSRFGIRNQEEPNHATNQVEEVRSGKKSNDAGENLRADSCSNLKNDYHRNSRGSNKGKNIMIELIEDFIFSSGKDKSPIIEGKDLMSNLGFTLQVKVGTISNPLIPIGPDGPYSLDPMNGLKFGLAMDSGTQSNISLGEIYTPNSNNNNNLSLYCLLISTIVFVTLDLRAEV